MNYIPRKDLYKDWCKIYRTYDGDDEDQEDIVLYEGECTLHGSGQMRRFQLGSTVKVDLGVSFPYPVSGIETGDLIDFESANFRRKGCEIVAPFTESIFGMGTSVFFNMTAN